MKVSIIVPAYKEAKNMEQLITRITKTLSSQEHEIIVVDDNSKDGTEDVIKQLQQQKHKVRLITRVNERGLSSAVLKGFAEARGEYVICMDADLQHPPEALVDFISMLKTKEFVIGTRYASGKMETQDWPLYRQIISKGARSLALPLTSLTDPMTGYFGLHRDVLERGKASPIGFKICMEIYVKCGVKSHGEVPITFGIRTEGESKLSSKVVVSYVMHLMELYWFKFRALILILVALLGLVMFCAVSKL